LERSSDIFDEVKSGFISDGEEAHAATQSAFHVSKDGNESLSRDLTARVYTKYCKQLSNLKQIDKHGWVWAHEPLTLTCGKLSFDFQKVFFLYSLVFQHLETNEPFSDNPVAAKQPFPIELCVACVLTHYAKRLIAPQRVQPIQIATCIN
jgi:hypothetical protein